MNAPWGRSQSGAAVVVLPRGVPCGADVLSRRCDIIAQAKSEGCPVTRRYAARSASRCSCGVLSHFRASRDALHPNFRPGYTRPTPPPYAGSSAPAAPGLLATKWASETRSGRLLWAIIRQAMPGPRPHEGAIVASLLREQRLSGQASQPSGIYRYLTRLRLHFASPHRLWRTYKRGSCRCHFEQISPRRSTRPSPAPAPTPQARPDAACSRDSGPRPTKTATAPPSTTGTITYHQARWSSLLAPP